MIGSDLPIWQTILISQILDSLRLNYVFPEKINEPKLREEITSGFKQRFLTPDYQLEDNVADKVQFAKDVSKILFELIGDPHIYLSFEPDNIEKNKDYIERHRKFPGDLPLDKPEFMTPEQKEKRQAELISKNCGFHDPKDIDQVLVTEHVGYIGLAFMANAEMFSIVREEAFRAMQRVQDKDAIIIDLRGNGGGSPAGVQYFLSFFFSEPTHINTFRKRENDVWQEKLSMTWPKDQLNPGGKFHDQPVPDLSEKPVYILIDENTISAGEELAYDMQQLGRATIIGTPSFGGAHPCGPKPLLGSPESDKATFNKNFMLYEPSVTAINPKSRTNWEDEPGIKGVQPHILVTGKDALARAVEEIPTPRAKLRF